MKKRDYYILVILIALVIVAVFYRKENCTNIEAQDEIKNNIIQETGVVPTSMLTDSIDSKAV